MPLITQCCRETIGASEATGPISTTLITVGSNDYYVHQSAFHRFFFSPSAFHEVPFKSFAKHLIACTIVNWAQDKFTEEDLNTIASSFANHDDVWNQAFLAVVVLRASESVSVNVTRDVAFVLTEISSNILPNGPCVIEPSSGDAFAVSRLLDDTYSAFIGGSVRPELPELTDRSFEWLKIKKRVAVPSRLYYETTPTRPLAGLRFAVKDIIDVAGLETGCGNSDYRRIYQRRKSSARCIQQLVDAGAIFVGKTKTTQFSEGQAPLQWFDYLPPFNPRGDSYQKPSSSCTGSAVATAAYPWIDFTVGTDTGGSIRHPAGVCGVYGLRPSTGAISSAGIYSVSPILDAVGLMARSTLMLEAAFTYMLDSSRLLLRPTPPQKKKYKLLYPIRAKGTKPGEPERWFPFPGEPGEFADVESQFEDFMRQLEAYTHCTRHAFNLDDLWRETRPNGQSDNLDVATGHIYTVLSTYTCVRETIDPFIADFQATNHGRSPFIDPVVKARQAHGRRISTAEHEAAVQSAEMFSKWINESLFATSDEDELTLLIFPQNWGRPDYRVDADERDLFFSTFSIYSLSYLSGCPDCTVPVGEVKRHSRLTEAKMLLPISLSILTPPGTDLALLGLLSDLEKVGILKPPAAGSSMYPTNIEAY